MNKREENMDLLRVIASIMVIATHVGAFYGKGINIKYPSYYFTIGNFYHSVTRTAVPIFVMLSGSFLLSNINNIDYKYHYKKTFNKIIIPTLIFSSLYLLYSTRMSIRNNSFNYLSVIESWILGRPYYHMWYMYMIIGCYAITPILIKIRLAIDKNKFELIGWIFLIIGIIIELIGWTLIWPIQFISYLGYFILGYSLKYRNKIEVNSYLLYLISSTILLIIIFLVTEFIVRYNVLENKFYFLEPLSPIVAISSICMYIAFLRMKNLKVKISNISKHTYNIYFLHVGIIEVVNSLILKVIKYPNPLWYIPILIIIGFLLSYIGSIILNNIVKVIKSKFIKVSISNNV